MCPAQRKGKQMEKVISFLTNKWFKFGVSFLSLGYPLFLGYVAWLFMGYYLEPTHQGALITLYIFINLIFFGLMLFTGKQIITRIVAMISPFLAFAILLFGFENWIVAIPPIVVSILIFLLCGMSETKKIILGTIYLIMYVVGVLVYLTFQMLFGNITLMDVDLSRRSTSYRYSPDEKYRIVLYVDPEGDASRSVSFYLEKTDKDISLPFLECRNAMNSLHIITSDYNKPADVEWKYNHTLFVDGRKREFNFNAVADDTSADNY